MAAPYSKHKAAKNADSQVITGVSSEEVDQWMTAANSTVAADADIVPDGWHSMRWLAKHVFGKSLSTTNRKIMGMLTGDAATTKDYRLLVNGRLKVVPHYKLKQLRK